LIENHRGAGAVASFLCVKPGYTFHLVQTDEHDYVRSVVETTSSDLWINGGYFVVQPEIFDYIEPGEDLVEQPFARLSEAQLLFANKYEGFWAPMDTLKDQQRLEQMVDSGNGPWKVWELDGVAAPEDVTARERG
jgi:glucose-1-phosphate cytidylyltransferase